MANPIEEQIKSITPEDIRGAWLADFISKKALDLLSKPQRELTKEERVAAVGYLSKVAKYVRRRDRKYEHLSESERKAKFDSKDRNIDEIPPVADEARRRRAERSALMFIRYYCTGLKRGGLLKTPVPGTMRKIIHAMQRGVETGVPYHIRMPRGHGKTSYVKGVVMWAICTGRSRLVECVAANGRKASGIMRDVWNCMLHSRRFGDDFPEIAVFLALLRARPIKPSSVTYRGASVGMAKTSTGFTLPTVDVDGQPVPSSGAMVFTIGFSSNVRGEVVGDQRPDLIVFDDLQDRDIANNPEQVQEKYELVNGDFMGGDSHTDVSSAFMTSTPIKPDDLSERFAKDSYWRTETYRMVESFPECFDPQGNEDLWHEFWRVWQHENKVEKRDPHPACNEFYRQHREEMDKGARVLNPGNFRRNEVSAIEHAMILYFRNPKTFAAEYQMEPVRDESIYTIDEQLILGHVLPGTAAGEIPESAVMVCICTDINPSYAFSTVAVAYDADMTSHYVDYWLTPCKIAGNASDTEFTQKIYEGLTIVHREICERGFKLTRPNTHWGVDGSGNQFDAVTKFAFDSPEARGCQVTALLGRTDKEFNPRVGTRKYSGRPGINGTVLCWNKATKREYVLFNKDRHEESAQRAWLSPAGTPGGATLFSMRNGHGLANHDEFLLQVCGEELRSKSCAAQDKFVYDWRERYKHDLGDSGYMTRALAGFHGLAAGVAFEGEDSSDDDVVFL